MKTPALILVTAALGISVGFTIGKGGGSHDGTPPDQADSGPSKTQSSRSSSDRKAGSAIEGNLAGLLMGREISQLSADDALKLLEPRLSMEGSGDPLEMARNYYELQLFLSKLPTSVLEQVIDLSRGSDTPDFRIRQLFCALTMHDWQKGMDWASRQPDAAAWKSVAIANLADSDPARAAGLYHDGMMNGSTFGAREAGYAIASASARQGLHPLLSFLDTLPVGEASNLLTNSVARPPKADIPAFLQEFSRRTAEGTLDHWTMNNLLANITQTNPEEARKWIDSQEPGKERFRLEMTYATNLSRQGGNEEELTRLKSAMAGEPGKEKEFFNAQADILLQTNPAMAAQLADALPVGAELTKEDVKRFDDSARGDSIVDLARLIKSPDEQASYLKDSLDNLRSRLKFNEADFRLLAHRIQSLSLTGTAASTVQEALADARQKALEN